MCVCVCLCARVCVCVCACMSTCRGRLVIPDVQVQINKGSFIVIVRRSSGRQYSRLIYLLFVNWKKCAEMDVKCRHSNLKNPHT